MKYQVGDNELLITRKSFRLYWFWRTVHVNIGIYRGVK